MSTAAGDAVALAGYAVATPFVVYLPLFKRMWNTRDTRLLLVQESGVVLIAAGWALRGDKGAAIGNGAYGLALAVGWLASGRR